MTERCAENYDALDAKGVALAGLAMVEGGQRRTEAIAVFRESRKIAMSPGIVGRVRRLLDMLGPVDTTGVIGSVCGAAEGRDDPGVNHSSA